MNKRLLFVLAAIVLAVTTAVGAKPRTAKDVRREKQQNEQQIKLARQKLSDNAEQTRRRINELSLLEAKVRIQSGSIDSLKARIDSTDRAIGRITDTIKILDKKANTLRDSYGKTLRAIRTRRQGMSDLSFVFAASSFMEAWRRARYLHEVGQWTVAKAAEVADARVAADQARQSLQKLRDKRQASLNVLAQSKQALDSSRAEASALIASLKKEGAGINKELRRREEQNRNLDRELDRIIAEEIRRREEAERKAALAAKEKEKEMAKEKEKKAQQPAKTETPATKPAEKPATKPAEKPAAKPAAQPTFESVAEADRKLTGSFRDNKGRLPFPVAGRYTVTSRFGTNTHPELSKVKIHNSGIDIDVPQGTQARAVYQGVVSSIFRMEGYHNIVILRHGQYLTVYAGIEKLAVKKGDKVARGQSLGTIFTDNADGGRTMLHFEIRLEKQKLNPLEWVR